MADEQQQPAEQPVTPNGFQPAAGEGLTHIDVTVSKSRGYQKAELTGRWHFAAPAQYVDAVPAIAELDAQLRAEAETILDELVAEAQAKKAQPAPAIAQAAAPAVAPQAPPVPGAPVPANAPGGGTHPNGPGWLVGQKPEGKGQFDYISHTVLSSDDFRTQVEGYLPGLGIDPGQVTVYDNRVGNYGCETTGNAVWSLVSCKASDGSPLKQVAGGKSLVSVDFNRDGSLWVRLTKVGEQAVNAVRMAQQMAGGAPAPQPQAQAGVQADAAVAAAFPQAQQMPPVAPPPSDNDVPF